MIIMDTNVMLKINGEEIPLNQYVTKILTKVNLAIVETLKGIDMENIQNIKIKIEKNK